MNDLDQKINKLQQELDQIRQMRDLSFTKNLERYSLADFIEGGNIDSASTLNETTVVPSVPSNVEHAAPYDFRVRILINGQPYYIGVYNI